MFNDKCKYCRKSTATDEPIVVLNSGRLAHESCARDYWLKKPTRYELLYTSFKIKI